MDVHNKAMRRVIQKDPQAEFYRGGSPTVVVKSNSIEFVFDTEGDQYAVINASIIKDSVVLIAHIGDSDFTEVLENTLSGIENWGEYCPGLTKLLSRKLPYNIGVISNPDGRKFAGIMRRIFGRQKECLDLIGDKAIRKEAAALAQIALLLHEEIRGSKIPAIRELAPLFCE